MRRLLLLILLLVIIVGVWLARDRLGDLLPQQLTSVLQGRTTTSREMMQTVTPLAQSAPAAVSAQGDVNAADAHAVNVAAAATNTPLPPPTPTPYTPPTPAPPQSYQVQAGDTLAAIARRFGTTAEILAEANGLADEGILVVGSTLTIPPPPTPPPPPANTIAYEVRQGDTLAKIARREGMGLAELKQLNAHLPDPDRLAVGEVIYIPARPTPAPTEPPAPTPTRVAEIVTIVEEGNSEEAAGEETESQPPAETGAGPSDPLLADEALPTLAPDATSVYAIPTPTPILVPTATPAPACPPAQQESRIWGVSFCRPLGWRMIEQIDPIVPGVILHRDELNGDRVLFAIYRTEGAPRKPLTSVLRTAQDLVPEQLDILIANGFNFSSPWQRIAGSEVAGQPDQRAQREGVYTLSGTPARVRLVVFNHENRRWELLMAAPADRWDLLVNGGEFDRLAESIAVFAPGGTR